MLSWLTAFVVSTTEQPSTITSVSTKNNSEHPGFETAIDKYHPWPSATQQLPNLSSFCVLAGEYSRLFRLERKWNQSPSLVKLLYWSLIFVVEWVECHDYKHWCNVILIVMLSVCQSWLARMTSSAGFTCPTFSSESIRISSSLLKFKRFVFVCHGDWTGVWTLVDKLGHTEELNNIVLKQKLMSPEVKVWFELVLWAQVSFRCFLHTDTWS